MVDRLTLATRRAPKSERDCTPESTIAIAGVLPEYSVWSPSHSWLLPVSYGQSWLDFRLARPETLTTAFGVTVRPGICWSLSSHFAGTETATPPIRPRDFDAFASTPAALASHFQALPAPSVPPELWMITSTRSFGFVLPLS